MIRNPGWSAMPVTARKLHARPQLKTFHATMLVTRAEEWWVEAETVEEAQALLAGGRGHRAAPGECVHIEMEGALEDTSLVRDD
jgi:hypothetical protein